MKLDNNQQMFLALVKAGLWEQDVRLSQFLEIDFNELYRLSEEQSVVGLVAAGIEHVKDVKVPQDVALSFVGTALQLEQQNKVMNAYLAKIITKMREESIFSLLVKGQGIAQCYERPLWRASGDIDLFLTEDNYKKADDLFTPLASYIEEEDNYILHKAFTIKQWVVELHGTLRNGLWRQLNHTVDETQTEVFEKEYVRSWLNGDTKIYLPRADEDAIFVFSHILGHFFQEGIGLRQICDWCRLLWTFKDSLNRKLLESRIKSMGVMTEWKGFAALAVDYLGMPVEAMPFYSDDKKWKRKAARVMEFVLETGNFGHNRDYSYRKKYPYIIYKAISFWKHLKDGAFFFSIFPLDSIKVTWRRMVVGVSVVLQGKKHE